MSLFGGVRRERRDAFGVHNPFENPTVPLSSIGLDNVFGQVDRNDSSGQSVTPETASSIPTFWRCVCLLGLIVSTCPLRTYTRKNKEELFPKILDPDNQNMRYTQQILWELTTMHIAVYGNAYVLKVRAWQVPPPPGVKQRPAKGSPAGDQVVDLRPIDPSRVKPKLSDGEKVFEVTRVNGDGTIDNTKPPQIMTTWEIMHIQGPGLDGFMGVSPVSAAKRTLGTAIAADKLAGRFFTSGSALTGVIEVKAPLTNQEQADEIRSRWMKKNGGVDNMAEVAVLDAETSFTPITIPPDELQFLESRRWQTTEIARWFGIPPHLVGDVEKSTSWGTGIEQQNIGFISYTIGGYTERIAPSVTREVIATRGQYTSFDLDKLMRGSMAERYEAYSTAINAGWMNRNEVRSKEDMMPGTGLDDYLVAINMQTVQMAKRMGAANLKNANNPPAPVVQAPQQGNDDDDDSDSDNDDEDNDQ